MSPPPGYADAAAELHRLGFRLQDGMWRCGSVSALLDVILREFIEMHGSDSGRVLLSELPTPSAIDRLAQTAEDS